MQQCPLPTDDLEHCLDLAAFAAKWYAEALRADEGRYAASSSDNAPEPQQSVVSPPEGSWAHAALWHAEMLAKDSKM